jgi:hypothetical protein
MAKKKKPKAAPKPTLATVAARLDAIETRIRLLGDHLQGLIGVTAELQQALQTYQTQVHEVLRRGSRTPPWASPSGWTSGTL